MLSRDSLCEFARRVRRRAYVRAACAINSIKIDFHPQCATHQTNHHPHALAYARPFSYSGLPLGSHKASTISQFESQAINIQTQRVTGRDATRRGAPGRFVLLSARSLYLASNFFPRRRTTRNASERHGGKGRIRWFEENVTFANHRERGRRGAQEGCAQYRTRNNASYRLVFPLPFAM